MTQASGARTELTLKLDGGGHVHARWDGNAFLLLAEQPNEQAKCEAALGMALSLAEAKILSRALGMFIEQHEAANAERQYKSTGAKG